MASRLLLKVAVAKKLDPFRYLVDFINIKYGLLSWDNGPPEE
jgi:hypothetical protein